MANASADVTHVTHDGQLQVRRTVVDERGAVTFHRSVLTPGVDLSKESPAIVERAKREWTPEVIKAHHAAMATIEAGRAEFVKSAKAKK